MKSLKVKLCLIVALTFVMITALFSFIGLTASANRYVTISGTSVFNTSGTAEIWAHAITTEDNGDAIDSYENYYYYTLFTFDDNEDTVTYRRNLAYKWYYNALDEDDYINEGEEESGGSASPAEPSAPVAEPGTGYLNMRIGFEELNFEKFVISFDSQQYNITKDEKTTNYVIFVPVDGSADQVYAVITDDGKIAEAKAADIDVSECTALKSDNIVIELGEEGVTEDGTFSVKIYNVDRTGAQDGSAAQTGFFNNIGKMYAKYVSSSTKPVTPITFKADFGTAEGEAEESGARARMTLYSLNGQSFILNRNAKGEVASTSRSIREVENDDGTVHYEGGQVNDTCPPVFCLDSGVSYIKEGSELSFSYTAVDVLTQSPSTVTGYFMLTYDQYNSGVDADNYEAERLFRTVTSDDDLYIYPHAAHYVPTASDIEGLAFDEEFKPVAAIKIYLKLTDTSSTGGQSTYVFLDWFVEDQYKLHLGKDVDSEHDYIAVASDETGAHFVYEDMTDGVNDGAWQTLLDEYQAKVDEAAKDLRAGTDDFYLPSVESLVADNSTEYTDMTFGIYYMVNTVDSTTSSSTGKKSSQLSIDLQNAGDYIFTIYANDSSSNSMWYTDKDGEKVEFTSSDIWTMYDDEDNEGLASYLPWFRFTAGISEISVEDPGEQDTAYVGTTYTAKSFDIEGISTSATYSLYRFNNDLYFKENGEVLTYQKYMEQKKDLFEGEGRKYFTNITAQSKLDKNSEEYEEYNAYAWNPSSRSFVPQDANGFYLIVCEVTSSQFPTQAAATEYMGIAASATPRPIKGEDTWLQDNMTSIILLSIAGAAFLGIILLLFIKPKNKGDIDEQYEAEVATKAKKKK